MAGLVKAFAEAAMVGGATWFAVTALFRHPLGLPIPHTATIRATRTAIGEELASFSVKFLIRRYVARRMRDDLAAAAAAYSAHRGEGRASARALAIDCRTSSRADDAHALGSIVKSAIAARLKAMEVSPDRRRVAPR